MQIKTYSSVQQIESIGPFVLTVGQFDGVHLGHQKIFSALRKISQALSIPSAIWTFSNLSTKAQPGRLQHPKLQESLLASHGIDTLFVVEFNAAISGMSAGDFLKSILIDKLHVRGLVLGANARLGQNRNTDALQFLAMAREAGLQTELVALQEMDGLSVSSSLIRQHIQANRLTEAEKLLGHPYAIGGLVVQDQMRATGLGFPTANIVIDDLCHPPNGVYACVVTLGQQRKPAIAYIGTRPTLTNSGRTVLEVHIPHWSGNLYGTHLFIDSLRWIRGEMQFASAQELKKQIELDMKSV